jgi:hypothetical protein
MPKERKPKLPHERDESTGEQSTGTADPSTASATDEGNRERMRQAHDDVESGRQDTDRGPPADQAYQRQRKK